MFHLRSMHWTWIAWGVAAYSSIAVPQIPLPTPFASHSILVDEWGIVSGIDNMPSAALETLDKILPRWPDDQNWSGVVDAG